ncbi:MAG: CidA/LrgA family protein [Rickettsiaceae bacterium]|nr:CidA/LrgA family protein [Rickettsiaceae bacterium]
MELLYIPIPDSVLGMIILFCVLVTKKKIPQELLNTGNSLLSYIGILFVPAGVGITMYQNLIYEQWLVIIVASVTSTILTLVVSCFIFKLIERPNK